MSKSPEPDSNPNTIFAGRYQLIEKIGQGGMGAVYKAIHTQMGRTCAIKLLLPIATDSDLSVERFKREAQLASRIDNPHAVTIYDFGEAENGSLYLVMEFIEGRPLGHIIRDERPLSIDRIFRITKQIADALSAAHALGIVHRDLKPENIMVTRKGEELDYVKVLDFGIAKTFNESGGENITKTGFILGTPYYMSPEQLSAERLDARSDVYSLALIVYEMLSGRLPFEGDNSQAVMIKRLTTEPLPLHQVAPSISPAVETVVMRALTRERSLRTASANLFVEELQRSLASTQVLPGRPTHEGAAEPSGQATIAILGKETNIDSQIHSSQQPYQSGSQVAPPEQKSFETIEDESNRDSANKSPSAYVTKNSQDMAGYQGNDTMTNQQQPFYSPTEVYHHTPAHSNEPVYSTTGSMAPKKSSLGIILAVVGVFVLIALGIGYILFSSTLFGTKSGVTDPPTRSSTANPTSRKSDEETAISHYESGKQHQDQSRMLTNSGSLPDAAEENKKAAEEYSKAIALKPNYPEAHENLGVAQYNLGNLTVAVIELKTAIDQYTLANQRPTSQVMTNYGLVLYDLKRFAEAAEAFKTGYSIAPTDTDLLAFQGFALQKAGKTENAKEVYRSYLATVPKGQYAEDIGMILSGRAQPPDSSGN